MGHPARPDPTPRTFGSVGAEPTQGLAPEPDRPGKRRTERWTTLFAGIGTIVAIAALVFSIVSYIKSANTQQKQAALQDLESSRGLLQQLRGEYPTISREEASQSVQLDTSLGTAATLLQQVGTAASAYDYLFIADAYRHDVHPEIAISLYELALKGHATATIYRLEALRGLALAEWAVGSLGAARRDFEQALTTADDSSDPQVAKEDDDAITNYLWTIEEADARNCAQVASHAAAYHRLDAALPNAYGHPAATDTAAVDRAVARCHRRSHR